MHTRPHGPTGKSWSDLFGVQRGEGGAGGQTEIIYVVNEKILNLSFVSDLWCRCLSAWNGDSLGCFCARCSRCAAFSFLRQREAKACCDFQGVWQTVWGLFFFIRFLAVSVNGWFWPVGENENKFIRTRMHTRTHTHTHTHTQLPQRERYCGKRTG